MDGKGPEQPLSKGAVREQERKSVAAKEASEEDIALARVFQIFGGKDLADAHAALVSDPDYISEIKSLIQKVENPDAVRSFEEGKSIAKRLHWFNGLVCHVCFLILLHYVKEGGLEELQCQTDRLDAANSEAQKQERLEGVDPFVVKLVKGLKSSIVLDQKLEELGWSERAAWPDLPELEEQGSPMQIMRGLQEKAAALEEREGLKALCVLEDLKSVCAPKLEEVGAAIEEVERNEQPEFGVMKRPMTEVLFLERLRKHKDQLQYTDQALRRLIRNGLTSGLRIERRDVEGSAALHHELSNAHGVIKKQKQKIRKLSRRGGMPDWDSMKEIIDENRHASNGRVNYAAVARALGRSDKTAKRWIAEARLMDYAEAR